MKTYLTSLVLATLVLVGMIAVPAAEARGRTGSTRIGGYTSSGKGSHYIGGYVSSGPAIRRR